MKGSSGRKVNSSTSIEKRLGAARGSACATLLPALAILVVCLPAAQASTLTLGQASTFGVFVLGNFTESGTDSQGRVAVGGNFDPAGGGGFTIASQMNDPAGTYDLVVGGNLTNNGYGLDGGDAFVGGTLNWTNITAPHNIMVNGGFTDTGGGSVGGTVGYYGSYAGPGYFTSTKLSSAMTSPINFLSAQTSLDSMSSTLATQTANGTSSFDGYSTYTLNGTSNSLNVFTLNGSTFSGATINITAPSSSTVIINVTGTADSFSGGSINLNGVADTHVIFNFASATSVSIANLAFNGTLLAPEAAFNGTYGQLNGQLIADSAQGTTEFHNALFSGTLPSGTAAPEPGTWVMLVGGIVLLAISRLRKSSRRD